MRYFSSFSIAFSLILATGLAADGQVLGTTGSVTELLLRFDRNGNGRIDAAERAAMMPAQVEEESVEYDLPLICEGETFGSGGGGGSASGQTTETEDSPSPLFVRWHARRDDQELLVDAPVEAQAPEPGADGYPVVEEEPTEPEAPRRSVGLSKAVQYRLLMNRRPIQLQPTRIRQAAVFGATRGLVKQGTVVAHSSCAPCRVDMLAVYRRAY